MTTDEQKAADKAIQYFLESRDHDNASLAAGSYLRIIQAAEIRERLKEPPPEDKSQLNLPIDQ